MSNYDIVYLTMPSVFYRGADKSLARPGKKQAQKHARDARDFNNIETRAVINLFFLQRKAQKEIHGFPTETLACLLPGREDRGGTVVKVLYYKSEGRWFDPS